MPYNEHVTKRCPIPQSTKLGEGVVSENNPLRDTFDAIADPTRRELIRLLAEAEEVPLHELTSQFQMGRTAVSKHLTILKEAGLVLDRKVGRETRFRLNAEPLREIQHWVSFYSKFWNTNLIRLQHLLEEEEE
nr:metalloregulator ArsR/SmtB family transcription factor [Paenibacillus lignilyticus]